jgi:diaminohydroxyphosphoribosylaminopyrimidine deaminase/5-amino-6-(5-phosphoribosylamino)uracil reductase
MTDSALTHHRPYVILKWAETADGFIARADGSSKWISGPTSRELVHRWRSRIDAILVGAGTALVDNPHLTARPARIREPHSRTPLRVILAGSAPLPHDLHLFDHSAKTLVFKTRGSEATPPGIETLSVSDSLHNLRPILRSLHERGVRSLLVEGGAQVLKSFLTQELWDELRVFRSPITFCDGVHAPPLPAGEPRRYHQIGEDTLMVVRSFYFGSTSPAVPRENCW